MKQNSSLKYQHGNIEQNNVWVKYWMYCMCCPLCVKSAVKPEQIVPLDAAAQVEPCTNQQPAALEGTDDATTINRPHRLEPQPQRNPLSLLPILIFFIRAAAVVSQVTFMACRMEHPASQFHSKLAWDVPHAKNLGHAFEPFRQRILHLLIETLLRLSGCCIVLL